MRATKAHRHAETLGRTNGDIGTELAGRREQRHGKQVCGDAGEGACVMCALDDRARVADAAVGCGVLKQDSADAEGFEVSRLWIANMQSHAEPFGSGAKDA